MTSYGYDDAGGGTIVPREVSKELARRGWDVTVFHPAVRDTGGRPYEIREMGAGRRAPGRRPQPPAPDARPRQPLARARRPADHARLRSHARRREARCRALPQPAQPRRGAARRDRRARPARLLLDPQLLADLPARLPARRRRGDVRRTGRPRRRLRRLRRLARPARTPGASGRHSRSLRALDRGLHGGLGRGAAHADRPGLPVRADRRRAPGDARRRADLERARPRARPRPRRRSPDGRLLRLRLLAQGPATAGRGRAACRLRRAREDPRRGAGGVRAQAGGARRARRARAQRPLRPRRPASAARRR